MRFASPYWLMLLGLIPLLAVLYAMAIRKRERLVNKLVSSHLKDLLVSAPSGRKRWLSHTLVLAGLFLLISALARPQFGQRPEEKERKGVEIEFMIDSSLSMAAEDVAPSRFEAAKGAVREILKQLKGDRVGLSLFTNAPLRVLPFTTDYASIEYFLSISDMKVFLNRGTNIDAAITRTLPAFDAKSNRSKVIVMLSDGEDEPGITYRPPDDLLAADLHIYTFGIGTDSGGPVPLRSEKDEVVGHMKDSGGREITTRLDEATLRKISAGYKGRYYRYSPTTVGAFVHDLDDLKREMMEGKEGLVYKDYFQYFLFAGLAMIFLGKAVLED